MKRIFKLDEISKILENKDLLTKFTEDYVTKESNRKSLLNNPYKQSIKKIEDMANIEIKVVSDDCPIENLVRLAEEIIKVNVDIIKGNFYNYHVSALKKELVDKELLLRTNTVPKERIRFVKKRIFEIKNKLDNAESDKKNSIIWLRDNCLSDFAIDGRIILKRLYIEGWLNGYEHLLGKEIKYL